MSNGATVLFRFTIELSDVDRGVYETLDFRVAMHPSESFQYLLTRVFAFALNRQPGLEFSKSGLGDPEGPAIMVSQGDGRIELWIEIGNPSTKKLHKASKSAEKVKVYTYKDPRLLVREAQSKEIHRANEIDVIAFESQFLDRLSRDLPRDVKWSLLVNEDVITVTTNQSTESMEIKRVKLGAEP